MEKFSAMGERNVFKQFAQVMALMAAFGPLLKAQTGELPNAPVVAQKPNTDKPVEAKRPQRVIDSATWPDNVPIPLDAIHFYEWEGKDGRKERATFSFTDDNHTLVMNGTPLQIRAKPKIIIPANFRVGVTRLTNVRGYRVMEGRPDHLRSDNYSALKLTDIPAIVEQLKTEGKNFRYPFDVYPGPFDPVTFKPEEEGYFDSLVDIAQGTLTIKQENEESEGENTEE